MAAKATKLQTTLLIKYADGVDAKGKEVIKNMRFSKVKTTATEQNIIECSLAAEKGTFSFLSEISFNL